MGLKTTPEEAAQLFATVDKNGDGKIDLKELISYIGNWSHTTEYILICIHYFSLVKNA